MDPDLVHTNTAVHTYRCRESPSVARSRLKPRLFEPSMQGGEDQLSLSSRPLRRRTQFHPSSRDPTIPATPVLVGHVLGHCNVFGCTSRIRADPSQIRRHYLPVSDMLPTLPSASGGSSFVEFDVSEHGKHYDRAYSLLAALVVSVGSLALHTPAQTLLQAWGRGRWLRAPWLPQWVSSSAPVP